MAEEKRGMFLPVFLTLATGTYGAVSMKIAYQMKAPGENGVVHQFQKAYFFTLVMFVGEALCLFAKWFDDWRNKRESPSNLSQNHSLNSSGSYAPVSSVQRHTQPKRGLGHVEKHYDDRDKPLLDDVEKNDGVSAQTQLVKPPLYFYLILCCFDLTATVVSGVGLQWVSASANQMLRGSTVLFTGIASVLILKNRLSKGQWFGILLVIFALALVGGSSSLRSAHTTTKSDEEVPSGKVLLGVLLVLIGSAFNSVQNVFEEKLLKGQNYAEVDSLEVVGWEGIFGTTLSAFIMLPIVQHIPGPDAGSAENTLDTLAMLNSRPVLLVMSILYAISLALMNNYSQIVSKHLSAVHRMLVSTCRTVFVWVVDIIIFYAFDPDLGESWDKWSFMQLGGFVLLVIGTIVYVLSRGKPTEPAPEAAVQADDGTTTGTYQMKQPEFAPLGASPFMKSHPRRH
eukprot:TRINITY_DN1475_c0_g5_i3.p1 TRINITY_DN1475_c0_g5~~TRINITY_DN1475_c0_g5_i3.p1  ORF type:complete len:488 (-),score=161.79 TRINITY_DN1475_c0_g5_i3:130-1491(-)